MPAASTAPAASAKGTATTAATTGGPAEPATATTTGGPAEPATATWPAKATAAAEAPRLLKILRPGETAIAHLLVAVEVLLHLRAVVAHRPPGVVRPLLPLIRGLIVLIDIAAAI